MFKTIFSKLITVFIAVVIFSFTVTGVVMYIFLGNFVSSEKEVILNQSADRINNLFNAYLENQGNPTVRFFFERMLESYSESTFSVIWIVDPTGHIVISRPELPPQISDKLKDETGYPRLPDEKQYRKAMLGQTDKNGVVRELGDFYGFFADEQFKEAGDSWLTVQKPFKYTDRDGKDRILAAVYLSTPMPEIIKARTSVFRLFIISVSISVILSIILVYIFSLRISKPLKEIKNAARVIAGGEFKKRLDIQTQDEIGELAISFNHMITALENLEDMRRGFIANVSHELRTPMTSIIGFIEGILDGTIPVGRQRDYLTIVRDEIKRLNRLVNDLLDLAKMESGEVELNLKAININELIRRCIIKLENLILEKNIRIEANFENEECFVQADPDAIERVVINLMHNAIKFTPDDGIIVLSTFNQKEKVHISIKDTGIGIEKDEMEMIWDRFYKTDKSRSKDKSGAGLGLAIVKSIISEHGQEIWAESEVGQGTRFTFTLNRS